MARCAPTSPWRSGRLPAWTTYPSENFLHPYASRSITEFWRRWHISLSSWFRDYLYIPLGGSREGRARTYINLSIVFLLCGLWHGAAWTFVLWGAFHGLVLVLERLGAGLLLERAPAAISIPVTVFLVALGWVLFRAVDVSHATDVYAALAGQVGALAQPLALHADAHVWTVLVIGILVAGPVYPALEERFASESPAPRALGAVSVLGLFALTVLSISGQTHSPFLYFRF